ncbi:MAG TPA: ABC transporter permease [Bacteroidales bacterium]|nr:ABC transporter permease [Bacteroidales bacterium]HPT01197.1 ABC transporter permease [Bacteroidales bacterium]
MKSLIKSIWAVAKREIDRMSSGTLYILAVLIFPVLTTLFFCSLMKEGVPAKMPIAIVDLDQTSTSRKMARNIDATPASDVVMSLQTEKEAMSELRKGSIYGYIVLPQNLQADIMANRQPVVSYYYHNGLFIAGGLLRNDFALITHTLSAGINIQKREAMGQSEQEIMAQVQPIQLNMHLLFNPRANYTVYVTTIILPIMMQIFILMMTVYSIGIEIKERTSREWLKLSDKSIVVALTGKLLPYTIIFLILMMFQNFMLYKVMAVPMNGGVGWIILSSFLFVLSYQAIGIFCIGLLPMMRHALVLAAFYAILALSLCGFSFPTESMSPIFQIWSYGFPVRHYMHIFQSQILAGFEPIYSARSIIYLLLFLLLPLIVLNRLKSALIYQNFIEDIHKTDIQAI